LEAFADNATSTPASATPDILIKSLEQLLVLFAHLQDGVPESMAEGETALLEGQDIHALAHYGMSLFADLTDWARLMHLSSAHDELRRLGFGFGLWVAQNGIEIVSLVQLAQLVDNLAFVANELSHIADFAQLYTATSQIVEAVSLTLTQQDGNANNQARHQAKNQAKNQAWNLLVLNRARIAIQSCNPTLMEHAFAGLVDLLPEEAPNFFQECVVQMEMAQYPKTTKAVVDKYFRLWCVPKILH
jgi:hypothetical protein